MADNLISRLEEKPMRYVAQASLAAFFAGETLGAIVKWTEGINNYEPQISGVAGEIGHWTSQIAHLMGEVGIIAGLGYIATKGAGMYLDRHLYKSQAEGHK